MTRLGMRLVRASREDTGPGVGWKASALDNGKPCFLVTLTKTDLGGWVIECRGGEDPSYPGYLPFLNGQGDLLPIPRPCVTYTKTYRWPTPDAEKKALAMYSRISDNTPIRSLVARYGFRAVPMPRH